MTREELYRDLTDVEFKVYNLIQDYNQGRELKREPAVEYIMNKTGKGRSTIFNTLASLRAKRVLR